MMFGIGLSLWFVAYLLGLYINESYGDLHWERVMYRIVGAMFLIGSGLITTSVVILAWGLLP